MEAQLKVLKRVRLRERRPVGRRTGGERNGRDACECRRSNKEPRTPQTAEPALGIAMIVFVHRDAVCLSLDRVHQLLPAAFVGASLVPAVKRKPYSTPVAVFVSFTRCPLRAVMVGFPLAKAPPTILRRTSFRVTATSRNWTWPILNVCPRPITWWWPFVHITAAVGAAGFTWTGFVTPGLVTAGAADAVAEGVKWNEG